jgi:folate-binding protein YgfZ
MSVMQFAPVEPKRGVLRVAGADRAEFLQGLISNDIGRIPAGGALWAALLTPQGKYLHDFFVVEDGDTLLLETEGAGTAALLRRLSMYRLRSKVTISDVSADYTSFVLWGDGVAGDGGSLVFADPRLTALGFRAILPAAAGAAMLAGQGFRLGDWAEWDRLRVSLGVPDGTRDLIPEKSILLESGFDELNGVAWDKGCWMGQELTARTKYRGLVKKRLMPVAFDGEAPPPGTAILTADGGEAGEFRSGTTCMAIALLRLDALGGAALSADGRPVQPVRPDWARW